MGQAALVTNDVALDTVITNALIVDAVSGIIKADVGIKVRLHTLTKGKIANTLQSDITNICHGKIANTENGKISQTLQDERLNSCQGNIANTCQSKIANTRRDKIATTNTLQGQIANIHPAKSADSHGILKLVEHYSTNL